MDFAEITARGNIIDKCLEEHGFIYGFSEDKAGYEDCISEEIDNPDNFHWYKHYPDSIPFGEDDYYDATIAFSFPKDKPLAFYLEVAETFKMYGGHFLASHAFEDLRKEMGWENFEISEKGQEMLQFQDDLAKQYGYKVQPPLIAQENIEKYDETLPEEFKRGKVITDGIKGDGIIYDAREEADKSPLYSLNGTKIANGYDRVVIGQYGAFLEIDPKDMCMENVECKKGQEYRINNPRYADRVKYQWFTTKDTSDCKLYFQQKGVTYADYQPNKWYISPYEVCSKEQLQILLSNENKEIKNFISEVENSLKDKAGLQKGDIKCL